MKNLFILLVMYLLIGCTMTSQTEYINSEEEIVLIVTPNTTQSELYEISSELLKERDVKLDFENTEFDKNGYIKTLDFKVEFSDGMKGTARTEYIGLAMNKWGFVRDYSTDSQTPFQIGAIE